MANRTSDNAMSVESQILQIYPPFITIPNFSTEHNYKEKITLYNISPYYMVFTLCSSDKERMKVSETYIKLNSNQTKHIYIMIRDNIKYFNNNIPHQRRIYLIIKSDLFEEKYPIDLLYNTFDHKDVAIYNNTSKYLRNLHQQQQQRYMAFPVVKEEMYEYNNNDINNNEDSYYEIISIQRVIQFQIISDNTEKDELICKLNEDKNELISYINNTLKNKWEQMGNILQRYDNELLAKCKRIYNNNELCFSKQNYFSLFMLSDTTTNTYSNRCDNNFTTTTTDNDVHNSEPNDHIPSINEINTLKSHNNLLITENALLTQRISLIEAKLALLPQTKLTKY